MTERPSLKSKYEYLYQVIRRLWRLCIETLLIRSGHCRMLFFSYTQIIIFEITMAIKHTMQHVVFLGTKILFQHDRTADIYIGMRELGVIYLEMF